MPAVQAPRIYNLFPLLAGPLSTWSEHLPRIAAMGFDWVYLNPFHAPGSSGSLYAIQDLDRLHPVVAGGDDGGSNVGNAGRVATQPVPSHGYARSVELTLPPLATVFLEASGPLPAERADT